MILTKEKYITVPKNEARIKEYESLIDESENMITYVLPEDEFETLDKHHVFDIINDKCDLMIDIYESETVSAEELKAVYDEISLLKGVWLDAVNKAIKYGTCVFLDF